MEAHDSDVQIRPNAYFLHIYRMLVWNSKNLQVMFFIWLGMKMHLITHLFRNLAKIREGKWN